MLVATVASLAILTASPAESPVTPPNPSGWSTGATVLGAASGGAILGMAIATEQLKMKGNMQAVPLGISAISLGVLMPPLVFLGGWLGRRSTGVKGSVALRIAAWIAYGGGLTAGIIAASSGAQRKDPMHGLVALAGGFSALSLALFAGDSMLSYRQARNARRRADTPARRATWIPWAAPLATPDGGAGGLVGVAGWF